MTPDLDPRRGDIEDDASSTKRRSMLSLAGSLLAEISIPKLLTAWVALIVLPSLMLGVAPVVAAIWVHKISDKVTTSLIGVWSAILLAGLALLGWFGGRRVLRLAESSFWSLNSLAVQPCYTACREALRHLIRRQSPDAGGVFGATVLHAAAAIVSGLLLCGVSLLILWLAWPFTYLSGSVAILSEPKHLALVALANSAVLVSAYVAVAALVWAIADATMPPPRDLDIIPGRHRRAAHVAHRASVGHPRRRRALRLPHRERPARAARQCAAAAGAGSSSPRSTPREPFDAILITGDITDAGRSAEWAEFLDAIAPLSRADAADADPARQPRPQHRRPRQSGAARSADQPEQAAAQAAHAGRHRRRAGHAGPRRRPAQRTARRHGGGRDGAAARGARGRSPTTAGRG